MTNSRNRALIGLGSNKPWLGQEPRALLGLAVNALRVLGGPLEVSPFYDSPAWPDPSGPRYVNAVVRLQTALTPEALLEALLAMEAGFGRVRADDPAGRYAPRTLDLDLLAFGSEIRRSERLLLPHPRIEERDFVLLPLADVDPAWRHPVSGRGVDALIKALTGISARRL